MSYNNSIYCQKCLDIPGAHSFSIIGTVRTGFNDTVCTELQPPKVHSLATDSTSNSHLLLFVLFLLNGKDNHIKRDVELKLNVDGIYGIYDVLYTKVADAKHYNDTIGILQHYKNLLALLEGKKWIWIFDCKDLGIKHCFEFQTAKGICDLLKQNGNVAHILIINSNIYLNIILDSISFFLDESIKSKIKKFTTMQTV